MASTSNGENTNDRRIKPMSDVVSSSSTDLEGRTAPSLHASNNVMAVVALCCCVVSLIYLISNLFPYSGYMCIHLVDGLTLENAGSRAGMLISSFMFGRFFSSYFWGRVADIYGRRFVLGISLINSAIFSVAFGLSTTFGMAITIRFLLGLGNGLMQVARTSITELAKGDREKESRGVGLIMSMLGYGMLFAPAIGGLLSNPLKQYPEFIWFDGRFDYILLEYPFILPNIVACVFSLFSLALVIIFVDETLPDERRRSVKHLLPDTFGSITNCFVALGRALNHIFCKNNIITSISKKMTTENDNECKEEISLLLPANSSNASYNSAQNGNSSRDNENPSEDNAEHNESTKQATVGGLLKQKNTRTYLISYWINSFASMCFSETFPLFAMSADGGLSMEENAIGAVGTFSGLLFCLFQYYIYTVMMKQFSLKKALRLSSLLCILSIFMPVSLLLQDGWVRIAFLSLLTANGSIMHSIFCACTTIGTNGTVQDSHRATVNGLASSGVSVARGSGPMFSGALVALSMTGMVIPAQYGSLLVYSILGAIGFVAYGSTMYLPEE